MHVNWLIIDDIASSDRMAIFGLTLIVVVLKYKIWISNILNNKINMYGNIVQISMII